jgi:hypothetical protein
MRVLGCGLVALAVACAAGGAAGGGVDGRSENGLGVLPRGVEPDAAVARARLVETTRRLYLATPVGERGGLLASMLVDELEPIRALGFDLAMREVAEGRDPGRAVADAAVRLMEGQSARGRARGVGLLGRMGPADAPGRILGALESETDGGAAAAMLRAMARWPGPELLPLIERWLSAEGEVQAAAASAGLALVEAGMFEDGARFDGGGGVGAGARREALLTVLRAWPASAQSPETVMLLVRVGGDADRQSVRELLESADAEQRARAARALAGDAGSRAALLEAASLDAGLFAFAASALGAGAEPTVEEFLQLARVPVGSGEQARAERMAGLMQVSARFDERGRLRAARAVGDDASLAESLLVSIVGAAGGAGVGGTADAGVVGEAAVLLAELRLRDRRHELALAALARVPEAADASVRSRAARCRVVAELAVGRVSSAAELAEVAPPGAWLDGLDRAILSPHAPAIIAAVRERVAARFTPADRRRFEFLCSKAALVAQPAESLRPAALNAGG